MYAETRVTIIYETERLILILKYTSKNSTSDELPDELLNSHQLNKTNNGAAGKEQEDPHMLVKHIAILHHFH